MCGIVGLFGFRDSALLSSMNRSIVHRGPDDSGVWESEQISLAMRRLAIIDLENGSQPMFAEMGRVVLIFNGEIFNFTELKKELETKSFDFKTNSDTEVVLHGYLSEGLSFINRLNGMFAMAIADLRDSPTLHLVRDRMGIKPLYYAFEEGKLIFASEIKALLNCNWIRRDADPVAIDLYLRYRYVPGPRTLFPQVRKLPPSTALTLKNGNLQSSNYWSPKKNSETVCDLSDAENELKRRMHEAAKRILVSDVPVGSYLSGGIDSSVIAALLSQHSAYRLKTFTVGFEHDLDEVSQARSTANYLGTEHHEIVCSSESFSKIEDIIYHLDEPIGDAIILPMYLLAEEAARHVKVVACGEGADEIFAGYLFHKVISTFSTYRKITPKILRKLFRVVYAGIPHSLLNLVFDYPANLGEAGKKKVGVFLDLIEKGTAGELFHYLISLFDEDVLNNLYTREFREYLKEKTFPARFWSEDHTPQENYFDQLLQLQYDSWLPELMLTKLDKITMAHSLEGRFLFLENELFDFVNALPRSQKLRGMKDKVILRKVAESLLPKEVVRRPKKPFFIPVEDMVKVKGEFGRLSFIRQDLDTGSREFLLRRREISLWFLNIFFNVHDVEAPHLS